MMRLEFSTTKTLTDNKLKFYEELAEELQRKEKGWVVELKRVKDEGEERAKEEKVKWERERTRCENAVGEMEGRVEAMVRDN